MKNLRQASLVASIEILNRHGFKIRDAMIYVADRCWLSKNQLEWLRKDFRRGRKWQVARDWIFEESRKEFLSEQEAIDHVNNLLTIANRSDQTS